MPAETHNGGKWMNSVYRCLVLCVFASAVAADDSTIRLDDFKSPLARKAVKTYTDRIDFLQQSMQEHLETATETLRESLKAALEQAAKDGDLKETERISKFLQTDASTPVDNSRSEDGKVLPGLRKENAQLRAEMERFENFRPVIVIEQTVDGNTKNSTQIVLQADGTILTSTPDLNASWTLQGRSLKLTWRSRNGVVVDANTLDEAGKQFSGTNNRGKRLSGRVLLGSFNAAKRVGKQ
ncbi:hypothetical protein [Planctomycetes bacterium TBK1r]